MQSQSLFDSLAVIQTLQPGDKLYIDRAGVLRVDPSTWMRPVIRRMAGVHADVIMIAVNRLVVQAMASRAPSDLLLAAGRGLRVMAYTYEAEGQLEVLGDIRQAADALMHCSRHIEHARVLKHAEALRTPVIVPVRTPDQIPERAVQVHVHAKSPSRNKRAAPASAMSIIMASETLS